MGLDFLLDTNTIIEYLGNDLPSETNRLLEFKPRIISVITQIELLSKPGEDEASMNFVRAFISTCSIVTIELPIVERAGNIRRTFRTKLPDAVIAATAIENGLILLTNNLTDFNRIPNLQLQASRG